MDIDPDLANFTLGVEEEFSIIDAATNALRPRADILVPRARESLGDEAQSELNLAQIETGTPVCSTLGDVRAELQRLRKEVMATAEEMGCRVLSTGTHPTGHWKDSTVNRSKERYRMLEDEFGLTARQQLVSGCHVHVGIADPDLAIAVLDRCRCWLSPLLALSANSPFWMGEDSGYASYRAQVWRQWPMTGLPEPLADRAQYDRLVDDLAATGVVPDASFFYWDVRPSAKYPTLEFRVADACLTIDEAVMVAGLVRGIARTCAAEALAGKPWTSVRGELVDAAKWRAARSGMDGDLVDLAVGEARPAGEVVERLLDHIRPALEQVGDWDEVKSLVDETIARGNGARRQREALARTGDLDAVVALLAEETARSVA